MYSDVTCIILAGGKSSRMGTDKALLELGGKKVIERIAAIVKPLFEKIILITNKPEHYKFLNLPLFKDVFPYKGPLAGIHSGLLHSETEKNFILSCDVPLLNGEMINYIVEYETERTIKMCYAAGYFQPLAAFYSKKILPELEFHLKNFEKLIEEGKIVKKKNYGMHHFLDSQMPEIIYPESLPFYSDELFFNMNNPEDYEYINKLFTS